LTVETQIFIEYLCASFLSIVALLVNSEKEEKLLSVETVIILVDREKKKKAKK
jgi:hypothetical protein